MSGVRRCTGINVRGERCGQLVRAAAAVPDDDVLCLVHRRGWPGRRCTGLNVRGDRCARMVQAGPQIDDERVLCAYHRRVNKHVAPRRVKCTATRSNGEPCDAWSLKERVDSDRPLCSYHAGLSIGRAVPPDHRRCTAVKANGERCKKWVLSDAPSPGEEDAASLCSMHAGVTGFEEGNELAWKHGYYSPLTPEESRAKMIFIQGRAEYSVCGTLDPGSDEWWELVGMCRLAIRGLLKNWTNGVVDKGPGLMNRHAEKAFQGARVIANLVAKGNGLVRKNGGWVREKPKALRTREDFDKWLAELPDEFWEEVEEMKARGEL